VKSALPKGRQFWSINGSISIIPIWQKTMTIKSYVSILIYCFVHWVSRLSVQDSGHISLDFNQVCFRQEYPCLNEFHPDEIIETTTFHWAGIQLGRHDNQDIKFAQRWHNLFSPAFYSGAGQIPAQLNSQTI
jgi:hypothetical protein